MNFFFGKLKRFIGKKKLLPKNPMHDDIYLVEFPKSGVTWLQHIIGNIELALAGKPDFLTFYNYHKYMPDLHQIKSSSIKRFFNRTFLKSHSEFNPNYFFVIYLMRNPIDVMVSYFNYLIDIGYSRSFEEFLKSENGIVAWKSHINSWHYKTTRAQRLHFLKYENLIKDAKTEITAIYQNLGVKIPHDILDYALEESSLENMHNSELFYKSRNPNYSMSFVGKSGKKKKSELLNDELKKYICKVAKNEIETFYPELLK